jgi:hypothetical protein
MRARILVAVPIVATVAFALGWLAARAVPAHERGHPGTTGLVTTAGASDCWEFTIEGFPEGFEHRLLGPAVRISAAPLSSATSSLRSDFSPDPASGPPTTHALGGILGPLGPPATLRVQLLDMTKLAPREWSGTEPLRLKLTLGTGAATVNGLVTLHGKQVAGSLTGGSGQWHEGELDLLALETTDETSRYSIVVLLRLLDR